LRRRRFRYAFFDGQRLDCGRLGNRLGFGSRHHRRLDRFHQARRRQDGCRWLGRLNRLLGRPALLALDHWSLGEDVTAWQGDIPLARQPLDELARDHFFDCARGALHLDTMIAFE
jgi:hypothetical protein